MLSENVKLWCFKEWKKKKEMKSFFSKSQLEQMYSVNAKFSLPIVILEGSMISLTHGCLSFHSLQELGAYNSHNGWGVPSQDQTTSLLWWMHKTISCFGMHFRSEFSASECGQKWASHMLKMLKLWSLTGPEICDIVRKLQWYHVTCLFIIAFY